MGSPPKPWERTAGIAPSSSMASTSTAASSAPAASASAPASSSVPVVPDRPISFQTATTAPAQPAFPAATSSYGSPYSSYNSPYSRFGSSYSPYGGGNGFMGSYGGYGGYGGFGGGMYGNSMYPGMGMNSLYNPAGGPPGFDPNNPNATLVGALEASTQPTFALLHSLVQTASGVAQMLESTFFATHSSFFAMVGVVDQLAALRNALGSVLGLFGLVRWLRDLLSGRAGPQSAMRGEFREFLDGRPVQGPRPPQPRPSKKPLVFFLLAIFGIPYAMHRLMKVLAERAAQGQLPLAPGQLPPLDPSQLSFGRALYPFTPSNSAELALKENEIVAIVGKLDPGTGAEVDPRMEVETEWYKGRTRDGRAGWFPRKWIQILERAQTQARVEGKKVDDVSAPVPAAEKDGKVAA